MLTEDLFNEVLIHPASVYSPDTLNIVTGYVSAGMVNRHFQALEKLEQSIRVNLIFGMTRYEEVSEQKHSALLKATETFAFDCRYIVTGIPVHAKVYIWMKDKQPVFAFAGSANYSFSAFNGKQWEAMSPCDSYAANEFYELIFQETVSCKDRNVKSHVKIIQNQARRQIPLSDSVELSFIDSRTGETHRKAGLNWGQRKGRDPNQAYIPIPSEIYNTNFFPPVGKPFHVLADDGETFIFSRAQQNGKALHTTVDNSLMGLYFRSRIGVGSGEYVHAKDLRQYGRTTVKISKIDDDNYLLDFSIDTKI